MKKRTQRIIVIVLAVVLLLSVLFPALSMLVGASVSKSDIDKMKGELNEIPALKNQAQNELAALRGDVSRAQDQIDLIRGQILRTEQEISISQQMLDYYDQEIAAKETEIAGLEADEAEQYAQFCSHVRWLEETGSVSYLSVLFQASSFSELLDYVTLIADIMDYSNEIIEDLQATQKELGEARDELADSRADQEEAHAVLQGQLAELGALEAEAQSLYNELAADAAEASAKASQLAAEEAAMKRELADAEKLFAAQIAALNNSGDWYWPLPGIYKLTSLFGNRKDPFTGRPANHTGIDIPAAYGTKIYAAQNGVVTTVGTNRNHSYGYYCIISHANGRATLYAHMNKIPSVKVGETVSKGQFIGYVGSTGRSTGPHLHFEMRINGSRTDALKSYPGYTFTYYGSGGRTTTIKGG